MTAGVGFIAAAGVFMLVMSAIAYGFGRALPAKREGDFGSWVRSLIYVPPLLIAIFFFALDIFVVVARALGYKFAGQ